MMYHCANCTEYIKSSKKLANETIESLTAYFQLLLEQCKLNGTLECINFDCLRKADDRK